MSPKQWSDTASSGSTDADDIEEYLKFPGPPPDPLLKPRRNSRINQMNQIESYPERLVSLLDPPNPKPPSADILAIIESLERLSARLDRASRMVTGCLDNERRRQSRESRAVRRGRMNFETVNEFRARLTGDGKRATKGELEEEEGEVAIHEDIEAGPRVKDEPNDDDEFPEMDTTELEALLYARWGGNDEPAEADATSHVKEPAVEKMKASDYEKKSDQALQRGLELIRRGARRAFHPSDRSSVHAIPLGQLIPELESLDETFRLRAHQRCGVGQILALERELKCWLLSDDPGLGKTLQVIAAIILDNLSGSDVGPTLGVVPLGLLRKIWEAELRRAPSLTTLIYHGEVVKQLTAKDIIKYKVVLTTYETLVSQWTPLHETYQDWPLLQLGDKTKLVKAPKKGRQGAAGASEAPKLIPKELRTTRPKAPLFHIKWRRVFLDEAHRIKRMATAASQATADLMAEFRGAITGTPIQNDYTDFYAIARFLHLDLWDKFGLFQQCFIEKAGKDAPHSSSSAKLDGMMQNAFACLRNCVTIRRVKGQKFDDAEITGVPEPRQWTNAVILGAENQDVQNAKQDLWDLRLRAVLRENARNKTQPVLPKRPDIFVDLGEGIVQAMHPILPTASYGVLGETVEQADADVADIDDEEQRKISMRIPERGELLERYNNATQAERDKTGKTRRAEFIKERTEKEDEQSEFIREALGIIMRTLEMEKEALLEIPDGTERKREQAYGKILVFAPYLSVLDLLAVALKRNGIPFYEINGYCTQTERDVVLRHVEEQDAHGKAKDFSLPHVLPDSIRVTLASVHVAAEGFNVVHASHVLMLGPLWNPYAEIQAISRAHRIGQPRQVVVYFIYVVHSMHERVRRVQLVKKRKVTGVMNDGHIRQAAPEIEKWSLSFFKDMMRSKAYAALDDIDAEAVEKVPMELDDYDDDGLDG